MTAIRTAEQLREAISAGFQPKYVFFWGHTPTRDGSVTSSCFSQWWEAPFTVDGVVYRTAEHYMMVAKARLFGDSSAAQRILAASHPKQAKAIGREVAGFDEGIWVRERFSLVVAGNLAKFSQHPPLQEFLLKTADRVLVEASPYDRIWGIGLGRDDEHAQSPETWKGLNLLGFALMEVRDRLSDSRAVGPKA